MASVAFLGFGVKYIGILLSHGYEKSGVQEVITITDKKVLVQRGLSEVEEELQMGWIQVTLESPVYRGYPSNLSIKSHGKSIEVGRFLVESERKELATQLKNYCNCLQLSF